IVSISERLPKKEGRIRRNLMGKKVGYIMRCVITCNSLLKIDELGVPKYHAERLTIPETVMASNIDKMYMYLRNKDKYPGCTNIITNGINYHVSKLDENFQLKYGDVLMRHIIDGDVL